MKASFSHPRKFSLLRVTLATAATLWVSATGVLAQWAEETFSLEPGWNAVWLSIDSSHDSPDVVLSNPAIVEVWRWERSASNVQFLESPAIPIQGDSQWKVWKRGEPGATTLGALTGNSGYLVRVEDGSPPLEFSMKGKPILPRQEALADGLNLLGYPMVPNGSVPAQSFAQLYAYSRDLKTNPPTFQYVGGPLSDTLPRNPVRVGSLTNTLVNRGQAYWVQTTAHTSYYGPIEVSLQGNLLDFGARGTTLTLRLKNATDTSRTPPQSVVATLSPVASETPPTTTPPQDGIAGAVPLKVRGPIDPITGNFALIPLTEGSPLAVTLSPGEEQEVVIVADRESMGSTAGLIFQSLLQISDSLGLTRIDLGVRAETSPLDGVWVGEARVTHVQQILGTRDPAEIQDPVPLPVRESAAFPLRLILHKASAGPSSLLQQVYLGNQDLEGNINAVAGTTEASLEPANTEGTIIVSARLSSSHFQVTEQPLAQAGGAFGTGASLQYTIQLPYNDSTHPFVHAYHPDHDNLGPLNDVAPAGLAPGVESPQISRVIVLDFEAQPDGLNDTSWGSSLLGGTYKETISGLRKESITVSGPFVIRKVSDAPVLRLP